MAGLWYKINFDAKTVDIELTEVLAKRLQSRGYNVVQADVLEYLRNDDNVYDTVNAIGVIHHILPDQKCIDVLHECMRHLSPDGVMIVGSYFKPWQVQYANTKGVIYKKCWSLHRWKKVMKGYDIHVYRNPVCRWRGLPQNNIMLIRRSPL